MRPAASAAASPRRSTSRDRGLAARPAALMRAAFCRAPGTLIVEDVPRPTPGAGEVVVRVRHCGICGSDLHWYHGQMVLPVGCPGHEISGEVADVGAGTIGLMAVVAARAGGAGEVIVVARRPQQRAAALALGADRVAGDREADGLLGDALEAPIDLVIETVGGEADTLDTAVAAARPGGTICLLGAFTRSPAFPALFV